MMFATVPVIRTNAATTKNHLRGTWFPEFGATKIEALEKGDQEQEMRSQWQ
jgi:hypothetical protein